MKYFPAYGPAKKERSCSFEGSALHKKNEIRVPDWILSLSALIWADTSLLAVSAGPSQIIYKFHAACNCDTGRVPSGLKKYSRETEFSLFNVMDFFSLS